MRKAIKWGLIVVLGGGAVILAWGLFVVEPRVSGKGEFPHANSEARYRAFVERVHPEAQFESHTCGMHTLRVIYRAYGIDPDLENLRARLGVDVPANPVDGASTGTLQPDLLRVLLQDGFGYELLELRDEAVAAKRLSEHLSAGQMAAVLVRRRENGAMHWVAAAGGDGGVEVFDSLVAEPYLEEAGDYINTCVLSCVLVAPEAEEGHRGWLLNGTGELVRTLDRYQVLGARVGE